MDLVSTHSSPCVSMLLVFNANFFFWLEPSGPEINRMATSGDTAANIVKKVFRSQVDPQQHPPHVEWNVAKLLDVDSYAQDHPYSPPLIIYRLGQVRHLSTDELGWREYDVVLGNTGQPRDQSGKEFVARCHRCWNMGEAQSLRQAWKESCDFMMMNFRIKKWLMLYQDDIKNLMDKDEPKPLELEALKLKVSVLAPFHFSSLQFQFSSKQVSNQATLFFHR